MNTNQGVPMPDDQAADERPQTKPFAAFLQEQRRGALHSELTDALADVVGAVVKHGKKGSLTIRLDIKPEGDEAITVSTTYAAKPPIPPAQPSIFFADETGQISRQRLNQPELPLKGLDGGQTTEQQTGGQEAAQA